MMATCKVNKDDFEFVWLNKESIFDNFCKHALFDHIQEHEATVVSIVKRKVTRRRPKPLNSVDLMLYLIEYMPKNMPAEIVYLQLEKLYDKGFISYPKSTS